MTPGFGQLRLPFCQTQTHSDTGTNLRQIHSERKISCASLGLPCPEEQSYRLPAVDSDPSAFARKRPSVTRARLSMS